MCRGRVPSQHQCPHTGELNYPMSGSAVPGYRIKCLFHSKCLHTGELNYPTSGSAVPGYRITCLFHSKCLHTGELNYPTSGSAVPGYRITCLLHSKCLHTGELNYPTSGSAVPGYRITCLFHRKRKLANFGFLREYAKVFSAKMYYGRGARGHCNFTKAFSSERKTCYRYSTTVLGAARITHYCIAGKFGGEFNLAGWRSPTAPPNLISAKLTSAISARKNNVMKFCFAIANRQI